MSEKYPLVLYPDTVLRGKALPIAEMDGELQKLISAMAEIMYHNGGIGLSAPQVGRLKRLIVADIGKGLLVLANPEIVQSQGSAHQEEGCLSLPEIRIGVTRREHILVRGINAQGREEEKVLHGMLARVVQHEIDHLNGKLIIDYAGLIDKYRISDQLSFLQKQYDQRQKRMNPV